MSEILENLSKEELIEKIYTLEDEIDNMKTIDYVCNQLNKNYLNQIGTMKCLKCEKIKFYVDNSPICKSGCGRICNDCFNINPFCGKCRKWNDLNVENQCVKEGDELMKKADKILEEKSLWNLFMNKLKL